MILALISSIESSFFMDNYVSSVQKSIGLSEQRCHNFCAGPAALPAAVLEQAREELLDYQGKGLSVMEMSHRSPEYQDIFRRAELDLRELLGISGGSSSDEYAVLFLQGGASLQFSSIPLNFGHKGFSADYLLTGMWSKAAIAEAKRFGSVRVVASSEDENFTYVPSADQWKLDSNARYLHITPNETIHGVEFDYESVLASGLTPSDNVPIVADLSSTILSRPINVDKYGLIYAGAQKNIGPAGVTVAIIRRSLLERKAPENIAFTVPRLLDYSNQSVGHSMVNTPPTYGIYLAGLVFDWLKRQGGLSAIHEVNQAKASKLYAVIDESGFYNNPVAKLSRSLMNVPFTLQDANLDGCFLEGAASAGLLNLKGHRSVGGMRASLYNAVAMDSVDALVEYMKYFEKKYG